MHGIIDISNFLFSFKYSRRPFTVAGQLPDHIDELIKSQRLTRLQNLQKEIAQVDNAAYVGKTVEVLVEGQAKRGHNYLSGRSRAGQIVNFSYSSETTPIVGDLVTVDITEGLLNSLKGRLRAIQGGV